MPELQTSSCAKKRLRKRPSVHGVNVPPPRSYKYFQTFIGASAGRRASFECGRSKESRHGLGILILENLTPWLAAQDLCLGHHFVTRQFSLVRICDAGTHQDIIQRHQPHRRLDVSPPKIGKPDKVVVPLAHHPRQLLLLAIKKRYGGRSQSCFPREWT